MQVKKIQMWVVIKQIELGQLAYLKFPESKNKLKIIVYIKLFIHFYPKFGSGQLVFVLCALECHQRCSMFYVKFARVLKKLFYEEHMRTTASELTVNQGFPHMETIH